MGKFKDNYIVKAWLVLSIALVFGSSLAGVEIFLKPKIAANKLNETLSLIPDLILKTVNDKTKAELKIEFKKVEILRGKRKVFYNVIQTSRDGNNAGWVIKSSGPGYADKIEVLIGFDPHMRFITGLYVLEQKETPGLGNKITEPVFRNQFLNVKTENTLSAVKAKRGEGEVDSITGATISSRSVCDIVNNVVKDLKTTLGSGSIKK